MKFGKLWSILQRTNRRKELKTIFILAQVRNAASLLKIIYIVCDKNSTSPKFTLIFSKFFQILHIRADFGWNIYIFLHKQQMAATRIPPFALNFRVSSTNPAKFRLKDECDLSVRWSGFNIAAPCHLELRIIYSAFHRVTSHPGLSNISLLKSRPLTEVDSP